jgi:hypothetical protein
MDNTWASPAGTIEASVAVAGTRLPFHRRADGRPFAAGVPGCAYTIGVRNMSSVRIEVILTVDGRHALRDEPGDAHACHGLVIPARGSHEFPGWQSGSASAGQFIFADPSASIAALATGSSAHTGVIGFAVHRERQAAETFDSYSPENVRRPGAPVAVAAAAGGSLGTGIGATVASPLGRTEFTRDGNPPGILVIGYDTEESLRAQGIIAAPAVAVHDRDAFPGQETGYRRYQA